MTMLNKNMVVPASNYILFYTARIILIFYGFVNFLGILWFGSITGFWSIVLGLIAGFTGIITGFSKINQKSTFNNLKNYIIVSIIGCAVTSYLGIKYILPKESSIQAGIPYIVVVLCYLIGMRYALKKMRSKNGATDLSPKN